MTSDIAGTSIAIVNGTVVAIQGKQVSVEPPLENQTLVYDGEQYVPTDLPVIPSSLPPDGYAGGDLIGSYPNPIVAKLQGQNISSVVPEDGYSLTFDGYAQEWQPKPIAIATNRLIKETFLSNGSWICPENVHEIILYGFGGGGGGGGGARPSTSITTGCAGAGSGGGGSPFVSRPVSVVPGRTYNIIIGVGGNGGTGATTNNSNGSNGTAGSATIFYDGIETDIKFSGAGWGVYGRSNVPADVYAFGGAENYVIAVPNEGGTWMEKDLWNAACRGGWGGRASNSNTPWGGGNGNGSNFNFNWSNGGPVGTNGTRYGGSGSGGGGGGGDGVQPPHGVAGGNGGGATGSPGANGNNADDNSGCGGSGGAGGGNGTSTSGNGGNGGKGGSGKLWITYVA